MAKKVSLLARALCVASGGHYPRTLKNMGRFCMRCGHPC